jgi:cobaltochelatase CobN
MHLLAARPGTIADGSAAVDLEQTPGEIVMLTAADTELACLAEAHRRRANPQTPSLRLANLLFLGHNLSVDLYLESVVQHARLVVVRLLGGERYWPYGVEQLSALARQKGIALALLPGDDRPDPELVRRSTLPADTLERLWRYLVEGGIENAGQMLDYAASLIGYERDWREPRPLLRAGLYWPGKSEPDLAAIRAHWREGRPRTLIVFYRALLQAGQMEAIDGLIRALDRAGLDALPVHAASLKEPMAAALIEKLVAETGPDVILNATAFALSQPNAARTATPFDAADCPVLQVVLASGGEVEWREGTRGLSSRDIAMHVALPELDGRVLTRAVAFKAEARRDEATQCGIVAQRPVPDRLAFVADLAAGWARLRRATPAQRRVALVLANYPNRDGRIGNGVGLDTPASAAGIVAALAQAGYDVGDAPRDGAALMARLLEGPTNSGRRGDSAIRWPLADYLAFLQTLPPAVREAVGARWGAPERDPFFAEGAFHLPGFAAGNLVLAVQPARGYNIDPVQSYHDPALVPPHGYLAFYGWLRRGFRAHAVVHVGKHGNLEWLPGKALALSAECWPEATLGPTPQLYPFIVNDPGEGSQAKRRTAAVILDHLTPPLARAESYGQLEALERLVDEYYEASGLDPRRCKLLRDQILDLARRLGLDKDCGIAADESADSALVKLDSHLCEIKELQIRDGLHVLGTSPEGLQRDELLVALARLPRGRGEGADQSILRALVEDLDLGEDFDPLDPDWTKPWTGARPDPLEMPGPWRHQGDTVERLERLALRLVAGEIEPEPDWTATRAVLGFIRDELAASVAACGKAEMAALLAGLDGRFVAPGPSGAPTRGRLEVLPTGRNFYSVDTRVVPTPAAWQLGWKSASMLIERYRQEHGAWPKALALSAWGTANMRTGGDDIAQALALMGVRPRWDQGSGRVAGFEILPLSLLGRPRVDVTFRISGFFRDAFPAQVDLIDSAARAVAALDEAPADNPLAARVAAEREALRASGLAPEAAERRAGARVFGSKPGAYGAGLQALIDERGWENAGDLAKAYVAWGGYAYGAGAEGEAAHGDFEARLARVEGVLHNQDNREHDLLDSDDYYQFEGGLAAAVAHLSGRRPVVYHNDHSRPETPKVRRLEEEIARVVRGRAANPKWIKGVMRHGYKGAFEMAATVDYLFAFAATTGVVGDHHFEALFDAYLADEDVAGFVRDANPAAGREMAERFAEAIERGLWRPRANSVHARLAAIREGRV